MGVCDGIDSVFLVKLQSHDLISTKLTAVNCVPKCNPIYEQPLGLKSAYALDKYVGLTSTKGRLVRGSFSNGPFILRGA